MKLLNRAEAICKLPEAAHFDHYYHALRLQRWDDVRNDSLNVYNLFLQRGDAMPWEIDFDGHKYRQGQCSGSAMSLVWFDRVE